MASDEEEEFEKGQLSLQKIFNYYVYREIYISLIRFLEDRVFIRKSVLRDPSFFTTEDIETLNSIVEACGKEDQHSGVPLRAFKKECDVISNIAKEILNTRGMFELNSVTNKEHFDRFIREWKDLPKPFTKEQPTERDGTELRVAIYSGPLKSFLDNHDLSVEKDKVDDITRRICAANHFHEQVVQELTVLRAQLASIPNIEQGFVSILSKSRPRRENHTWIELFEELCVRVHNIETRVSETRPTEITTEITKDKETGVLRAQVWLENMQTSVYNTLMGVFSHYNSGNEVSRTASINRGGSDGGGTEEETDGDTGDSEEGKDGDTSDVTTHAGPQHLGRRLIRDPSHSTQHLSSFRTRTRRRIDERDIHQVLFESAYDAHHGYNKEEEETFLTCLLNTTKQVKTIYKNMLVPNKDIYLYIDRVMSVFSRAYVLDSIYRAQGSQVINYVRTRSSTETTQ